MMAAIQNGIVDCVFIQKLNYFALTLKIFLKNTKVVMESVLKTQKGSNNSFESVCQIFVSLERPQ